VISVERAFCLCFSLFWSIKALSTYLSAMVPYCFIAEYTIVCAPLSFTVVIFLEFLNVITGWFLFVCIFFYCRACYFRLNEYVCFTMCYSFDFVRFRGRWWDGTFLVSKRNIQCLKLQLQHHAQIVIDSLAPGTDLALKIITRWDSGIWTDWRLLPWPFMIHFLEILIIAIT
jgi:hypothetical protein